MILARNLYGRDQSLLLGNGQPLKASYIEKIRRLGYSGVFIKDSISDDIVIESMISDQLKISAVTAVKDVFIASCGEGSGLDAMEKTKEIVEDLINEILYNRNLMVNMIDLKVFDDYTFYHSVNVAVLSILMGVSIFMQHAALYSLGLGALLHDIGKIFISKDILSKDGPLDDEEMGIIRQHPSLGYEYLVNHYDIPAKAYLGALHHQERYDGSGYPLALKGEHISQIGRIIAIADVYDALTSDRPYRKALLPSSAMEYIMGGSGTMFDPHFVSEFTRKVAAYPLGTIVLLSDGSRGIVIRNYEDCCTRPCVRIVSAGDEVGESEYVDLRDDYATTRLTIVGIEKW
jgi:HD-GYP domain